MAIKDEKKDLKLGQTVVEAIANADDNFTTLFDNQDDLQTQINSKEPAISSKGTAFNKNFSTADPKMDGTASAGTSDTVARGDHVHPTDTSRLAAAPDGKTTLLDSNNKIRSSYLPDEVLGQLEYQGTWDASKSTSPASTDPKKGHYYVCSVGGKYNPDGTQIPTEQQAYAVGDWAVYNGTSWDKVDNTDAVTMVNGQIGSVETYRGTHTSGTTYHKGDMVKNGADNCLYLCIKDAPTNTAITATDYWHIFGKTYSNATTSAAGLMSAQDKTNLDANTLARHSHSNKTLLDSYTQTETNLKDAVAKKHEHSNKSILDNTTASYTTEEKTKLGKIDDSLLDKTIDDFGKVKDVKQNGTSVLDSDGVADIIAGYKITLKPRTTQITDELYVHLKADKTSTIMYCPLTSVDTYRIYHQQEVSAAGLTYVCVDDASDSLYQAVYEIFIEEAVVGDKLHCITHVSKNIEMAANKATAIDTSNNQSDVKYPSTKAVAEYVKKEVKVTDVQKRDGTSIVSNGIAKIPNLYNGKDLLTVQVSTTGWQETTINGKTYYMIALSREAPIATVTNADGFEIVYQLKIVNGLPTIIVAEKQILNIWYSHVTL